MEVKRGEPTKPSPIEIGKLGAHFDRLGISPPGGVKFVDPQKGKLLTRLLPVEGREDITFDPTTKKRYLVGGGGVVIGGVLNPNVAEVIEEAPLKVLAESFLSTFFGHRTDAIDLEALAGKTDTLDFVLETLQSVGQGKETFVIPPDENLREDIRFEAPVEKAERQIGTYLGHKLTKGGISEAGKSVIEKGLKIITGEAL